MSGASLSGLAEFYPACLVLAGFCLAVAAGTAFYLASGQQQWCRVRPPSRPCLGAGALFSLLSLVGFVAATDWLVGVFMTVAMLMLVLSLLPFVVALHARKGARP
ncbi:hypothetical protein [Asaia bogorensis]|uniref:hypothetical protein n=1 Tax=Asaia bogorensis TaxID=91915 RepID=UPI002867991E|nr:hypothetical protein [Asaia bogorensis]MDR6183302.1 hypothetical protein [Asaia bogorensis NBRC 16594]